jgi:hypothetical protein
VNLVPANPGFFWVKPTDRFEDNGWQPAMLDKDGVLWLIGTSYSYVKSRYQKWEWGEEIVQLPPMRIVGGPGNQTRPH